MVRRVLLLIRSRRAADPPAGVGAEPPGLRAVRSLHGQGRALPARFGGEPEVGVLLIHRVNNYLGHIAASELARRGFLVLAMNSRFDNNEAAVFWEQIALDVKTGVEYLKRQEGVRRVVLFGHSGGAATLSFYQAVAEKGIGYCAAPGKLTVCGKELSNLPRADGLILVDASLGNPCGAPPRFESGGRARGRSEGARSRARSVQSRQWVQPERRVHLYTRVQAEVLRGAVGAHEPSDRVGWRTSRTSWAAIAVHSQTTTSFSSCARRGPGSPTAT